MASLCAYRLTWRIHRGAALFEVLQIFIREHAADILFAATDVDVAELTVLDEAPQRLDRYAKPICGRSGGTQWRH
jgi:hypothetical protein